MVVNEIASKIFGRVPDVIEGEDPRMFVPDYTVNEGSISTVGCYRSKFADLPAFGLWADRTESDEGFLERLGSGWRGFAVE